MQFVPLVDGPSWLENGPDDTWGAQLPGEACGVQLQLQVLCMDKLSVR